MLKAILSGMLLVGPLMALETQQNLKQLISEDQIQTRIKEVAHQINQEYQGKEITFIMVMKGAFIIMADLIREITVPCQVEAVTATSYGQNGTVSGTLTLKGLEDISLKGRHVILVDDILDTGKTMTSIKDQLLLQEPASLKTLVLLLKNRPRSITYTPDYFLFPIENEFVIGYGLDYKELYRGLRGIYIVEGGFE
jgi:hypoxanthine phosphoribosyltransferase